MSIFGRDEQSSSSPSSSSPASPPAKPVATPPRSTDAKARGGSTQVAAGTRIEGEISGSTEVVIDGTLEGRVSVESLVSVGKSGQVRGEIRARSVAVAGKVFGNIVGEDKVDIHSSGKLEGDVKAPRVSIAEGAYFKGRVEMIGKGSTEDSKATSPAPDRSKARLPESGRSTSSSSGDDSSGKDGSTQPVTTTPIRPKSASSLDSAKASESAK